METNATPTSLMAGPDHRGRNDKRGKLNQSAGEKLWKRRAENALGNRRSDFHFSHSFNNNKLDDRDHFSENPKASVASLRRLITPIPEC